MVAMRHVGGSHSHFVVVSRYARDVNRQKRDIATKKWFLPSENVRQLAYEFELDQSQHRSSQVGGQTKPKLNGSQKFALTCESVWLGLKIVTH